MGEPAPICYAEARPAMRTGDVLLWRGRRLFSWLIRWLGRSPYSHAGFVVVLQLPGGRDRVMVCESVEGVGCRIVPLSSALQAGGWLDLYRVAPRSFAELDRDRLEDAALARLSQRYGWRTILRIFRRRLLPVGQASSMDDGAPSRATMVCSEYVAHCFRAAGLDLVPRRSDETTEPGDLALSAHLDLLGRLVS